MKKIKLMFLVAGLLSAVSASAQTQRSEAEAQGREEEGRVGITNFAMRPTAGAIFFNETERFAGGVLVDFNFLSTPVVKIGPATGAIFSSTGTGDFFSGVSTNNESYIFQIPANLKVTFAPDPARKLQLGVHGGANIIRTNGAAAAFGGTTGTITGGTNVATTDVSSWDAHGNVGADIDYALGTNVDLTLRPDVTFLANFNMLTATLGVGIKL